jgi:hypothetical protein
MKIVSLIKGTILIIIIFLLGYATFIFAIDSYEEYAEYKEYNKFCKERPLFCYCSWGECEFKTRTWTSSQTINGELTENSSGMSKETEEICELANKLNDKKMLFKIGCKQ